MLTKLKALWARVRIRWHVLTLAFVAALPELLNWLGFIDLRPVLEHLGVPEGLAGLLVAVLPFLLVFVKKAFELEPEDDR